MAANVGVEEATAQAAPGGKCLQEQAKRHLWMHFTRMGAYADHEVPIIVRGEGCYVYDEHGKRYLDGLAALFCVNAGHGRAELAEAAAAQAKELGFYINWSYAHPRAIELAARIAVARAGRPQPRVLHLGRLGGGRVGLEAGPQLPPAERRGHAHQADRARARLPRHVAGRARRDRADRPARPSSSRSRRAAATCRTRTATAGPPTATRSGRPTRSRSGSSSRAPRRSPP